MARPLLRCFTEASLTFHIFTCLGAIRVCSTKSGSNWTARHGKLFYWDTREILFHMWLPQQMDQTQGHQRSGYNETSTSTTMHFLTNVVLQSPNGRARTMMHLNWMLMISNPCHMNNARLLLRKPMQSRANQKITPIQMKGHPMLQTLQQQCSRRQPDVREGLEARLNLCDGERIGETGTSL